MFISTRTFAVTNVNVYIREHEIITTSSVLEGDAGEESLRTREYGKGKGNSGKPRDQYGFGHDSCLLHRSRPRRTPRCMQYLQDGHSLQEVA